jgi:CheY-like chemotaxis protein
MALLDNATLGAERGAALTQRMLAFARRQELKPEPTDVPALVRGMTSLLRQSRGPMVSIETRFPLVLNAVQADANQLESALLNLTVNARDAMPEGGSIIFAAREEAVTAQSHSLKPGRYVCLSVEDAGEGMDEAVLAKVREPFFTTKGPGKGTGLGLSMVDGMMAQLGGDLVIKSRKGEGTTVELWLPAADAKPKPPVEARHSTGSETGAVRSLVVLAVDDDSLVLMNTVAMLEDLGHRVFEAGSAKQALEILRREVAIDLVITDQAMPQMTGLELVDAITRDWPTLPVIIATGYAELPANAYATVPRLEKPYRQADLAGAIADTIEAKRVANRVLKFRAR